MTEDRQRERKRGGRRRERQTDRRRGVGEIKCSRVHNMAWDKYGQG
jgi:hypothetical protein